MKRLGVNIDHIATIRNARGGIHPDPLTAAKLAVDSGADVITVHLREDRRHINEEDVQKLIQTINVPINLELACADEMIDFALEERANIGKNFSFLDLGCGNGWVVRDVAQNKLCDRSVGIDGAKQMIVNAESRCGKTK